MPFYWLVAALARACELLFSALSVDCAFPCELAMHYRGWLHTWLALVRVRVRVLVQVPVDRDVSQGVAADLQPGGH